MNQQFKSIPEFPTVALPVAVILVLMLVMGRKKKNQLSRTFAVERRNQ